MPKNGELCFNPNSLPFDQEGECDDMVVIQLDQARKEHEERSFQRRKKLFEETSQFPFVPGPETRFSFDKPELYFSLDEILTGEYLTCEVMNRERLPLGVISELENGLTILPAERSLLRPLHTMIVETEYHQHEFTYRSLEVGAELAAAGLLVAFNGYNNSSHTNHWNCVDIRTDFLPEGLPQIKIRDDFDTLSSLQEAPKIYKELIAEGHLLTAVLSPDRYSGEIGVGFIQHSLPLESCLYSRRDGIPPFPFTFDLQNASKVEIEDLFLRMKLGMGYLEASTLNLVVKKVEHMSPYEHLMRYRSWTSPLRIYGKNS